MVEFLTEGGELMVNISENYLMSKVPAGWRVLYI